MSHGGIRLEHVRVCAEIGLECLDSDPVKRPITQQMIERLDELERTHGSIETNHSATPVSVLMPYTHSPRCHIVHGNVHITILSFLFDRQMKQSCYIVQHEKDCSSSGIFLEYIKVAVINYHTCKRVLKMTLILFEFK